MFQGGICFAGDLILHSEQRMLIQKGFAWNEGEEARLHTVDMLLRVLLFLHRTLDSSWRQRVFTQIRVPGSLRALRSCGGLPRGKT